MSQGPKEYNKKDQEIRKLICCIFDNILSIAIEASLSPIEDKGDENRFELIRVKFLNHVFTHSFSICLITALWHSSPIS